MLEYWTNILVSSRGAMLFCYTQYLCASIPSAIQSIFLYSFDTKGLSKGFNWPLPTPLHCFKKSTTKLW